MGVYEFISFYFLLFCMVKYKKGIRNFCYCIIDLVYIVYVLIKFIFSFVFVYMYDIYIIKYMKIKLNLIF